MVTERMVIQIGVTDNVGASGVNCVNSVVHKAETKILLTNKPRLRITRLSGCKYSLMNTRIRRRTLINSTSSRRTCKYATQGE